MTGCEVQVREGCEFQVGSGTHGLRWSVHYLPTLGLTLALPHQPSGSLLVRM